MRMPRQICVFRPNLRSWWASAKMYCPLNGSAVPSKVIIRPQRGSLLFITQPDHAAAAADLVQHFDGFRSNPRRAEIHLAVREHDSGWHELDRDLVFDGARGKAHDFMTVPEPWKQSVWPKAIEQVAPTSPYAAALIAEHAIFVYSVNRGTPEWDTFFETMETRRTDLLARAGIPLDTLRTDYPFLGVADLVSLSFCHGWETPKARFGRTVICEGAAVTMTPSLLPEAPVPVRVRMRRIPDESFDSHAALRQALERAAAEFLTGVARAGSTA